MCITPPERSYDEPINNNIKARLLTESLAVSVTTGVFNSFLLTPDSLIETKNEQATHPTNQPTKQPAKQITLLDTNKQGNERRKKQTNKQTNKSTNKQGSKQTSKQTSKQPSGLLFV